MTTMTAPATAEHAHDAWGVLTEPATLTIRRVLPEVTFPGQQLRIALLQVLPALGNKERDVFRRPRHPP